MTTPQTPRREIEALIREIRSLETHLPEFRLHRTAAEDPQQRALADTVVPPYDDAWDLRGDFAYEGKFALGKAFIWYGQGNTKLTKPLVLIEGFDPLNDVNYLTLYRLMNSKDSITKARQKGFDIVILDFDAGNDYIQRNAFLTVALLQLIRSRVTSGQQTCILGASMGGLVVRYALAYMASRGLQHNTRLFVSFDAPQLGACIPLGLQHFLSYFSRYSGAEPIRKQIADTIDSVAARQMLVYHYDWAGGDAGNIPHGNPLRTTLLRELTEMGSYAAGIRKVAIANGSGKGTNFFTPFSMLLDWDRTGAWGLCRALPKFNVNGWDQIFYGWYCGDTIWAKDVKSAYPYDSCPGGSRDTVKFVAEQLVSLAGGTIKTKQDLHCFIPTLSALDGRDITDPNNPDKNVEALIASGTFQTPFDRYLFADSNEAHIEVTDRIAAFIESEVGIT